MVSISEKKPIRPAKKRNLLKTLSRNKTLLLMCLPAITFFVVFNYCPMPGAYIAFTNFNYGLGIFKSEFIGFENFKFLINSGKLWMLTRNTILYNLAFIIFGNILQVSIAVLLNEVASKWFKKVSQSIMFLPYFISAVLVGLLAFNILNYDFGFLNSVIKTFGGEPAKVYSSPKVWPMIIIIVNLWKTTGYGSVVYFAAICGIDPEIVGGVQNRRRQCFAKDTVYHFTQPQTYSYNPLPFRFRRYFKRQLRSLLQSGRSVLMRHFSRIRTL